MCLEFIHVLPLDKRIYLHLKKYFLFTILSDIDKPTFLYHCARIFSRHSFSCFHKLLCFTNRLRLTSKYQFFSLRITATLKGRIFSWHLSFMDCQVSESTSGPSGRIGRPTVRPNGPTSAPCAFAASVYVYNCTY
jgi:hypothetical protein